jgi:hypothetical protein
MDRALHYFSRRLSADVADELDPHLSFSEDEARARGLEDGEAQCGRPQTLWQSRQAF